MTAEQKAAYVNAQAALLNAKIAAMIAVNQNRDRRGLAQAYGEEQFDGVVQEFEGMLNHNALISMFHGY